MNRLYSVGLFLFVLVSFLALRSSCEHATAAVALMFLGDLVLEPRGILNLGLKRYRAVLDPLQTGQMAVQDLYNLVDLYTQTHKNITMLVTFLEMTTRQNQNR